MTNSQKAKRAKAKRHKIARQQGDWRHILYREPHEGESRPVPEAMCLVAPRRSCKNANNK
jgi:hypothetical protein